MESSGPHSHQLPLRTLACSIGHGLSEGNYFQGKIGERIGIFEDETGTLLPSQAWDLLFV